MKIGQNRKNSHFRTQYNRSESCNLSSDPRNVYNLAYRNRKNLSLANNADYKYPDIGYRKHCRSGS